MISPETPIDVLAEIARALDRIANALESFKGRVKVEGYIHPHAVNLTIETRD